MQRGADTEGSFMGERAIDIIDASIRHVQRSAARSGDRQLEAVRTRSQHVIT